ncbi:Putative MetA-pathway of phenol degradation [Sphingomonas guangdongensis]|uniref:MetA-pathway of phenol degradation n=1 Tax=Sphingomonas guangdongensis TaxID=1141890 RepID=A0A285R3G5_9SPHN|nr:transporter [Sphingomonas guangdongensis]SOB86902.1 Putative MetA-pathway of phenol degradation [Sphingomonas guangdongensis]
MIRPAAIAAALVMAAPAFAQDEPRFCPNRPDLSSSGCTTEPGRVQFEWSAFDWQRDDSQDTREDSFLAADVLARIGVGAHTEVQLGWSPAGRVRTRDLATGAAETTRGVSDVRVGVRQGFGPPDGDGWLAGAEGYVTVPVGRTPVGAGDWGAGAIIPVGYTSGPWLFELTGEIDAAVNESGHGRHLAYSGIAEVARDLGTSVTLAAELMVAQDDDPDRATTQVLGAASVAWQPTKRFQLDLLAAAGLNRDTPDFRLVTGGAILF